MLRRNIITMSISIQLHPIGRPFSNTNTPVPHGSRFREPCGDRRAVPIETPVVSYINRVDIGRPHVVEILGNDRTKHGPRPQVRLGFASFFRAGKHP